MISIKTKLIAFILIITVISMGFLSLFNYFMTSGVIQKALADAAVKSAEYNAALVNQLLQNVTNQIFFLAHDQGVKKFDRERCAALIEEMSTKNKEYDLVFIADGQGSSLFQEDDMNIADKGFFTQAINGETVISKPMISDTSGKLVFVVAVPVYDNDLNKPVGVAGAYINIGYLQGLVKKMTLSGQGYGFIQDQNISMIAHPIDTYLGNQKVYDKADKGFKKILQTMASGSNGYGIYNSKGEQKLIAYAPVGINGWSVAQIADLEVIMQPLVDIRERSVMVTVVALVLILLVTMGMLNVFTRPLIKLSQVTETIAKGDLSQQISVGTSSGEVSVLAGAFNKMVNSLKQMIVEIKLNSSYLASHSKELSGLSEQLQASINEVNGTSENVTAITSLGTDKAKKAVEISREVARMVEEGNNAVQVTVKNVNSIFDSAKDIRTIIQKLENHSLLIGRSTEIIAGIADRTNLLALNAAIEAARAGEHGRGFSIVAMEVRDLAGQSSSAAHEIKELVEKIGVGITDVINAIEYGIAEVEKGVKLADIAGQDLTKIINVVEKNTLMIKDVAVSCEEINEAMQQITTSGDHISGSINQVSDAARGLAQIAIKLQETVNILRV